MELTTKVRDQNRGTTGTTCDLTIPPHVAKIIHEQLLAVALLSANKSDLANGTKKADSIVLVTSGMYLRVYSEVFDQPGPDEIK